MNQPSMTPKTAVDELVKVGSEEAKLDPATAAEIGLAAAALRRRNLGTDGITEPTELPDVIVPIGSSQHSRGNPLPGRWTRIAAAAAVIVLSIVAVRVLSQRDQAVSTQPAENSEVVGTTVVDPPPEETPTSTLIVAAGPTSSNIAGDSNDTDDSVDQPEPTTQEDPASSTAETSSLPETVPSTATTTRDEGSSSGIQQGAIRLTIGEAGDARVQIVDNVVSVTSVDASDGWSYTTGALAGDAGQELRFSSPDASAWLTVAAGPSQFDLELDQEGGSVYRFDRRRSRVFDIGQAGRATLEHDVTGLVGLEVDVFDGWTLSTSTGSSPAATNTMTLHLTGPANGYRTNTEITVHDLLIVITSSDP